MTYSSDASFEVNRLDSSGFTDRLWEELVERYPEDIREVGFYEEADPTEETGKTDIEIHVVDNKEGTQEKTSGNEKATSSEKISKSRLKIYDSIEEIPAEYKDNKTREPFGPLIGNKTELGHAIHPNAEITSESQLRRYLRKASGKRVCLRDAQSGKLAAYFQTKSDWEMSAKKLAERRSN
jgi:hypothetical protein